MNKLLELARVIAVAPNLHSEIRAARMFVEHWQTQKFPGDLAELVDKISADLKKAEEDIKLLLDRIGEL